MRERVGLVLVTLLLVAFVAHRVAVIYSAGDFVFALEPSEVKHTQIAWDLRTGRYGTDGFHLGGYVANSGSVYYGSYFTCSMAFLLVSLVAGFDMVAVRITPLLFWVGGYVLFVGAMFRRFGPAEAVLTALGLILVPSQIIGLQIALVGSHNEAILPLAALLATWGAWLARPPPSWLTALLGACLGYAVAFSYLLLPIAGLVVAITLLPPRPPLPARTWGVGVAGALVGLWPIWLIIGLEPAALFRNAITERPETTPLALATAGGASWEMIRETLARNLPEGAYDFWVSQATLPALWGGQWFESWAWRLVVLGPLLLLPGALRATEPAQRKLGSLLAVAPALSYLFLCVTTPWKPHVPVRYMIPMLALAAAGPGVAVSLARARRTWPSRAVATGAVLATLWMAGPRVWEAGAAIRPSRWGLNAQHRLVTYYNLGVHTLWAEDVPAMNDLLDVRSASGDPQAFAGIQAAMWAGGATYGLGRGSWSPEETIDWPALGSAIGEWQERISYALPEERDDPALAAENIGWGLGIRTRWNPARVAQILAAAGAAWPVEVEQALVWEGFGMGWGRADPAVPARASQLPLSIPPEARDHVVRGLERGRALGVVPRSPVPPPFASVRGAAT